MSICRTGTAALIAALVGLAGCSREPAAPQAAVTNAPAAPAARQAINDITGKTAVDAGRQARGKIEDISAARKKDLEEVTE